MFWTIECCPREGLLPFDPSLTETTILSRADAEVWRHAGQISIQFHAALDCLCVTPCSVPVRKVLAMDHHPHARDYRKRFGKCSVCNDSGFRSRSGHRMQAMPRDQDYGPSLSFGLVDGYCNCLWDSTDSRFTSFGGGLTERTPEGYRPLLLGSVRTIFFRSPPSH